MDIISSTPPRKFKLKYGALIAGGLVVLYAILVVGVNMYSWRGPVVRQVVKYVPVPVATIGWQIVWASDVLEQRAALEIFNAYQAAQQIAQTDTTTDTTASALTKTVKDLVVRRLANDRNVVVSDKDVDDAYTTLVGQSTSSAEVDQNLNELYGWKPVEFKNFVVRQDLTRDKLREVYAFDEALTADLKTQVDAIKTEISADGSNFAELATKYSQDDYGASGGDIGFVPRGALVKELDEAAFSLDINQVSDVIRTKYGFHLIQPIARKGEGDDQETQIRSIFIAAPSVDDATVKFLSEKSISVWLRAVRWDTNLSAAVVR